MGEVRYVSSAQKKPAPASSPEVERLKAEKLEADRKFVEQKTRQTKIQSTLREVDLRKKRYELIARAEVERRTSFFMVAFKQRLLALPAILSRKLDVKDKHAARLIIDEEVKSALNELADMPEKVCVAQELNDEQWLNEVIARAKE
jgi:hypothetical protein